MTAGSPYRKVFIDAGQLSRIVVLGCGRMAVRIARFAQQHEIECHVFAGPRQAQARLPDGELVTDRLVELGARMSIVEDIRTCEQGPYQMAHDDAVLLGL